MYLREALLQISEIHRHIVQAGECRALGSASVGFGGLLAILGGAAQFWIVPTPSEQVERYLLLWITIAVIAFSIPVLRLAVRRPRADSLLDRQMLRFIAAHFGPALISGGLFTLILYRAAPESLWIAPGLWATCFGLGIFAVEERFPRGTIFVGWFYLLGGLFCIVLARDQHAFSPWAMAGVFGCGQLLAAVVLRFRWERNNG